MGNAVADADAASQLMEFHRQWLPRFELPDSSQKVLRYFFDRDAGTSGLAALVSTNPAIAAVLSQAFDDRSGHDRSESRSLEFIISRLGLENSRKLVLEHQLRLHWRLVLERSLAPRIDFSRALKFTEQLEVDPARIAYADSAFIAGLLWDLIEVKSLDPRGRTWVDSRWKLCLEEMSRVIGLAEEIPGFSAKRWLAASYSALCVAQAVAGVVDPSFAEKVLVWERKRLPKSAQALLKSRHLGFSLHAAAGWICSRIEVLSPISEAVRSIDSPSVLSRATIEVRQLADVLGRATEVR